MIKRYLQLVVFVSVSALISHRSHAETVYVIDNIMAGIYQEQSLDSPVVKLIPTGTKLNVISRENDLVQVETDDGLKGWIGTNYIMDEVPARTIVDQIHAENAKIKYELENAQQKIRSLTQAGNTAAKTTVAGPSPEIDQLQKQNKELNKQFNAERLKVGQLQAELTELRNRMGQGLDADALYEQIEQLQNDNKNLQAQVQNTVFDGNPDDGTTPITAISNMNWRSIAISLAVSLVIGIILGIALLDYYSRKRHGGFRI